MIFESVLSLQQIFIIDYTYRYHRCNTFPHKSQGQELFSRSLGLGLGLVQLSPAQLSSAQLSQSNRSARVVKVLTHSDVIIVHIWYIMLYILVNGAQNVLQLDAILVVFSKYYSVSLISVWF